MGINSRIKAGDLDRRIIIQQLSSGFDGAGQPVITWNTFKSGWASLKTRISINHESILANSNESVTKAFFRMRYRTNITAGMRVVLESDTTIIYNITGVASSDVNKDFIDLSVERVHAFS